jgi:hypothetical protein
MPRAAHAFEATIAANQLKIRGGRPRPSDLVISLRLRQAANFTAADGFGVANPTSRLISRPWILPTRAQVK